MMGEDDQRPTWDEYFLMLAKLAATRSTCLAFPVGAVIVKKNWLQRHAIWFGSLYSPGILLSWLE